jgi:glycosyltransferase involved in cell wall biosynthesis
MEGFGLPPMEAMACGGVVLVSDLAVFREVSGECAEYCAVEDVAGWSRKACDLLAERSEESSRWECRRQNGIARSAEFRWSEVARRTRELYEQLTLERPAGSRS